MPDLRSDFNLPALVRPEDFGWIKSPGGEVERMMLDRLGDEIAVATSLVRYAPASRFPPHEHARGEEYLVLEGEFADERGRYPPGTYVRNPPGTRHTPFSDPGCVIWVKLRQFDSGDDRQLVIRTPAAVPEAGIERSELHRHRGEVVAIVAAAADAVVELHRSEHVQEVLVLDGLIQWRDQRIGRWGWLRLPVGEGGQISAIEPCRLLHKTRPAFALADKDIMPTTSSASGGK